MKRLLMSLGVLGLVMVPVITLHGPSAFGQKGELLSCTQFVTSDEECMTILRAECSGTALRSGFEKGVLRPFNTKTDDPPRVTCLNCQLGKLALSPPGGTSGLVRHVCVGHKPIIK